MSQIIACTIVSNNYLAFARVFAKSFLEHHPDGQVFTLIVDRPDPRVDYADEPFHSVFVEDLGIEAFRNMAFRYSILELNTAVKPFWLTYLHQQTGASRVFYFDPDILVLAPMDDFFSKLESHDVLLTPHVTGPIDDSHHPSERDILSAGIYNLGFLGAALNPRTRKFFEWWGDRLHKTGYSQVEQGLFVDQKWMDFAPAFLERALIVHDPALNAAYWNLMQRHPRMEKGEWRVGESRLRFFHFSGFDPRNVERISKHQDRFRLSDLPDLKPLFERYSKLLAEEGADEVADLPYTYGSFDNGVGVPAFCRKALQSLDREGRRWPDPFAVGEGSFYQWLHQPDPYFRELPRWALSVWDADPQCWQLFSFDHPEDPERFGRWLLSEGVRIHNVDEAFLEDWESQLGGRGAVLRAGRHPVWKGAKRSDLDSILRSQRRGALKEWLWRLGKASHFWLAPELGLDREGPRVSRLALAIQLSRQDLRDRYPEPLGASCADFASWFVTHGASEYELPPAAFEPVMSSFPVRQRLRLRLWWLLRKRVLRFKVEERGEGAQHPESDAGQRPPVAVDEDAGALPLSSARRGVHVIGYLNAPTGKGEEGRGTLAALEAASVPHRAWVVDGRTQRFSREDSHLLSTQPSDLALVLYHVNADMMGAVRRHMPVRLRTVPLHVGYWDWELSHFPLSFADRFEGLDEVWAPSRFCQQSFASLSPLPVRWVPPCVIAAQSGIEPERLSSVPDQAFLFFNSFDVRSSPERKNPRGLLQAFNLLYRQAGEKVHLLLKINHAQDGLEVVQELKAEAEGLPVTFMTEQKTRPEMNALMAACDCYVSLHRSEGLGLPLIEAAYLEKPVVATDYSGNTDFLDESTGWPVNYNMCRLEKDIGPYPAGTVWADADPEHAAFQMAEVLYQPRERQKRAQAALRKALDLYSPAAAGRRLAQELDRLLP
ncbi:MAG TPA: glycosyltransferase [Acidobacteriota bacterium]|nr:glycosyltransferase [Acidobacteriota bacterium]